MKIATNSHLLHSMEARPQGRMVNWQIFCHNKHKQNTQGGMSFPSPSNSSAKKEKILVLPNILFTWGTYTFEWNIWILAQIHPRLKWKEVMCSTQRINASNMLGTLLCNKENISCVICFVTSSAEEDCLKSQMSFYACLTYFFCLNDIHF